MNFGKWIVVSFILFATFIGVLVTVCMRQEVDLVSKDYYQQELDYQKQIARIENASSLVQQPIISLNDQNLVIKFERFAEIENGQLILFSPSNLRNDRSVFIKSSSSQEQLLPLDDIAPGMYRAKFLWSMAGKDYYVEKMIHLQ